MNAWTRMKSFPTEQNINIHSSITLLIIIIILCLRRDNTRMTALQKNENDVANVGVDESVLEKRSIINNNSNSIKNNKDDQTKCDDVDMIAKKLEDINNGPMLISLSDMNKNRDNNI